MVLKSSVKKNAGSAVGAIIKGATVSVLMTLVMTSILATAITAETISEKNVNFCANAVLLLSGFAGTISASWKGKYLRTSLFVGLAYVGVLLATTAILFDCQYIGVGISLAAVLSGVALAVLFVNGCKLKTKTRRSKIRRR